MNRAGLEPATNGLKVRYSTNWVIDSNSALYQRLQIPQQLELCTIRCYGGSLVSLHKWLCLPTKSYRRLKVGSPISAQVVELPLKNTTNSAKVRYPQLSHREYLKINMDKILFYLTYHPHLSDRLRCRNLLQSLHQRNHTENGFLVSAKLKVSLLATITSIY